MKLNYVTILNRFFQWCKKNIFIGQEIGFEKGSDNECELEEVRNFRRSSKSRLFVNLRQRDSFWKRGTLKEMYKRKLAKKILEDF